MSIHEIPDGEPVTWETLEKIIDESDGLKLAEWQRGALKHMFDGPTVRTWDQNLRPILPGPTRRQATIAMLWARLRALGASPKWTLPDDMFDHSEWLQPSTEELRSSSLELRFGAILDEVRELTRHIGLEDDPLDPSQWTIAVGDDEPEARADGKPPVPKPSHTPPMWANNPGRTKRKRNRASDIRTPRS